MLVAVAQVRITKLSLSSFRFFFFLMLLLLFCTFCWYNSTGFQSMGNKGSTFHSMQWLIQNLHPWYWPPQPPPLSNPSLFTSYTCYTPGSVRTDVDSLVANSTEIIYKFQPKWAVGMRGLYVCVCVTLQIKLDNCFPDKLDTVDTCLLCVDVAFIWGQKDSAWSFSLRPSLSQAVSEWMELTMISGSGRRSLASS